MNVCFQVAQLEADEKRRRERQAEVQAQRQAEEEKLIGKRQKDLRDAEAEAEKAEVARQREEAEEARNARQEGRGWSTKEVRGRRAQSQAAERVERCSRRMGTA